MAAESGDSLWGVVRSVDRHAGSLPCAGQSEWQRQWAGSHRRHRCAASAAAVDQYADFGVQVGVYRGGESGQADAWPAPVAGGVLWPNCPDWCGMVAHRTVHLRQPLPMGRDP